MATFAVLDMGQTLLSFTHAHTETESDCDRAPPSGEEGAAVCEC